MVGFEVSPEAWMYMRGENVQQAELFSYGSLETLVPADHPLRPIRAMVDEALREMSARFDEIYPEEIPSLRNG